MIDLDDDQIEAAFREWIATAVPDFLSEARKMNGWPMVTVTLKFRDLDGNAIKFVAGITFGDKDERA